MKQTNAEDFRSQLKAWMEKARSQPVKINRKNGESFILLNEEYFAELNAELIALRGQYQGLLDAFHGRVTPADSESIANIFEKVKMNSRAAIKSKKAIG